MNKQNADRVTSFVMLTIAALFLAERNVKYPANVFPNITIALLVICSLIIFLRTFSKNSKAQEKDKKNEKIPKKILYLTLGTLAYLGVMNFVGFYVTSFIYMIIIAYSLQASSISQTKRVSGSILMSFIVVVLVYLLFRGFLKVPTPQGFLI